ncbi:MAG: aspartate/glutamate racemase family protein [Candidatus Aminicenantes bacterium]|nr:aspartate/glutamate racemase family protein [Candidatus Aminicenantes bacterium]
MTVNGKVLSTFILISLICSACAEKPSFAQEDSLSDIFDMEEVTIAVTDSGLGGLSIMAEAAERTKEWRGFQKANFIFFNALFSNEGGYNSLKSLAEKVSIFDSALRSLEENYHPDMILIGCNTLSSIFEETVFSKQTKIPVAGIIDSSVELIAQNLKAHPESKIILFATQTTVSQSSYTDRLREKGFLPERIVSQACPELVNYIERDYDSEETEMLIFAYVDEALKKMGDHRAPLIVSLNCTHYGYSLDLWRKAFTNLYIEPLAYLNPNSKMIEFLFPQKLRNRFKSTDISVRIISMVEIGQEKINSIGTYLQKLSPQTAHALENYELQETLFEWKKYIQDGQKKSSSSNE